MTSLFVAYPLAMWTPGPFELALISIVGLLLFGKRLPEVGKSLGRSIVEFKKGIKGVEDDIESESTKPALPKQETSKQIPAEAESKTEA